MNTPLFFRFRLFVKENGDSGAVVGLLPNDHPENDRRSVNTSAERDGSVRSAEEDTRSLSMYNADEVGGLNQGLFNSSTLQRRKPTPRKKTPGGHAATVGLFQKLRFVMSLVTLVTILRNTLGLSSCLN